MNVGGNSYLTQIEFVGVYTILINIGGFCAAIYFAGYLILSIGVKHGFSNAVLSRIMAFNEGRSKNEINLLIKRRLSVENIYELYDRLEDQQHDIKSNKRINS